MSSLTDDALDQFSTSHTNSADVGKIDDLIPVDDTHWRKIIEQSNVSREVWQETENLIAEAEENQAARCENGTPFIFYVDKNKKARLVQGCCNSWTCERCGVLRAKQEYGRMVNGAKVLSKKGITLYFLTITCRGRELSLEDAEAGYKDWCDRFLTAMRNRQKRECDKAQAHLPEDKRSKPEWYYGGVTERQKRLHPHSHMTISYCPPDAVPYEKGALLPNGTIAKHDCYYSEWMVKAAVRAGLGPMCDISLVKSAVAVAVYQSKYMFKDAMMTVWPKNWKRVRYSQSWPKLPKHKPEIAFPVIRSTDWLMVDAMEMTVYADTFDTWEVAKSHGAYSVKYKKS